ncbi:hypothetical protein ACCS66_35505 [Rhizobium ruizarguesonis]
MLAEIVNESITLRRERPILSIHDSRPERSFKDEADSLIWKERLDKATPALDIAIRAAGRIELAGGDLDWVGTGWLVHDDILVTNRHVAAEFALRDGSGFVFKQGNDWPVTAAIDFLEEIDNPRELIFRILRPHHIEEAPGPDVALFQVELISGEAKLAMPLKLASKPGRVGISRRHRLPRFRRQDPGHRSDGTPVRQDLGQHLLCEAKKYNLE